MLHMHNVIDTDKYFNIDPKTREITFLGEHKLKLIQEDHNSERVTFAVPRHVDGHDMLTCTKVKVHYNNISASTKEQNSDTYIVDDIRVSPDSDDVVIFSWLISGNATMYAGVLAILIGFECTTGETIDYAWHTGIYSGITVGEGMNNGEASIREYTDVLAHWQAEIDRLAPCALMSLEQTQKSTESGGVNVLTATFGDGRQETFEVKNGKDGVDGMDGNDGKDGADGTNCFVRYSHYPDGTDFSETFGEHEYIGFAMGLTAPTDKSGYTWSKFRATPDETVANGAVTLDKLANETKAAFVPSYDGTGGDRVYAFSHEGRNTTFPYGDGIEPWSFPMRDADGCFEINTGTKATSAVNKGYVDEVFGEVESIAKGASKAEVFDTKAEMDAWIEENQNDIQIGTPLYIRALDVPDYWWDGTRALESEAKTDLSDYPTFADVECFAGKKTQDGGEIFNDYQNNKALSQYAHAEGYNTIAGAKAFSLPAWTVDPEKHVYTSADQLSDGSGWYYLGSVEGISTKLSELATSADKKLLYTIVLGSNYDLNGEILEVDEINKKVRVSNYQLPLESGATLIDDESYLFLVVYSSTKNTYEYINLGDKAIGEHAHAEGRNAKAVGIDSHTEGRETLALGKYAHTEGRETVATYCAHAEGKSTQARGEYSHAEGNSSIAEGDNSHAEAYKTHAIGYGSHAEGGNTQSVGRLSHAEGSQTKSQGDASHAEGLLTIASGYHSHAEGESTKSVGTSSHAEGSHVESQGGYSHAEGYKTVASGDYSHAQGESTKAVGIASHAEGNSTQARGKYSHAEGVSTSVSEGAEGAHAEGGSTTASNQYSHAEGYKTVASGDYSHAQGEITKAVGRSSHAEGRETQAWGEYSHAEGYASAAYAPASHAEGSGTQANDNSAHAEGYFSKALGVYSHAEGYLSEAQANSAHAEGYETKAIGLYSHTEGKYTEASGQFAHAGGKETHATHIGSFAHGVGLYSGRNYQAVFGEYNNKENTALLVVGNGSSTQEANAFTVNKDGTATVQTDPIKDNDVATKKFVEDYIAKLEARIVELEARLAQ